MVEKVIFAASTEESRYSLNGIYFEAISEGEKNAVRMVATDGHRLAFIEREGPEFSGMKQGAIIPKRGLNEVKKIVAEYPGELRVSVTENSLVVKVVPFTAVIRLIDGEFPDYNQVIPKENDKIIRVNTKEFGSCLRRVLTISSDRAEGVKVTLRKGVLELHSSSQDVGNATEEFAVMYDGSEMSIGFNGRYIIDALNAIDDDECLLELKDESNAVIIRPAAAENPVYVIMPMRI
jgi:DNA polymerase-3 subunit beta